jgi:heme oxygenase (mycobilin-producing)
VSDAVPAATDASRTKPLGPRSARRGILGRVTIIKINAITVPPESGDELGRRFAARAGAVDRQDGFEGFELLRPIDDRTTWLVVTRWRDEAAFQAWVSSPAFGHGHQGPRPAAEPAESDPAPPAAAAPLAMTSELWSYETAHQAPPR